jgi:hypothetical protein
LASGARTPAARAGALMVALRAVFHK